MKTLHVYPKNHKSRDAEGNKKVLVETLTPLLTELKLPVPPHLGEAFDAAVATCSGNRFSDSVNQLIAKLADSNQTALDYSIVVSHA